VLSDKIPRFSGRQLPGQRRPRFGIGVLHERLCLCSCRERLWARTQCLLQAVHHFPPGADSSAVEKKTANPSNMMLRFGLHLRFTSRMQAARQSATG